MMRSSSISASVQIAAIVLMVFAVSCGDRGMSGPTTPPAASTAARGGQPRPITTDEVEGHLRFLAHDALEGRGMGSRGIEIAALYQESVYRSLGLEPAFDGSYRQPFTLRGSMPDREPSLSVATDEPIELTPWDDFVVGTHLEEQEPVTGELVYAGFLIDAPERQWDDIAGMDLSDAILIVEVNEPGNEEGGIFEGTAMTYYGRWTYKYEKASELGARGVLIIHNRRGAAYGWDVVRNSWSGESLFVPGQHLTVGFYGWLQEPVAERIIRAAGQDPDALRARANTREFEPVRLGVEATVAQEPTFRSLDGENVAGILRGGHPDHRERYVAVTAHYDHLGRDESLEGDQIYNGAVDNCTASAAMLSLARRLADERESLPLDVIFLAVAGEEEGLLGSRYYAANPPVPIESIWANINFELTNPWGETTDLYAIGAGESELDEVCRVAAERIGATYIEEQGREHGWFYRSDQLSFARAGVPALWLHEGPTAAGDDPERVLRRAAEWRETAYHQVTDEVQDDWDLASIVQIARWGREIIHLLGDRDERPCYLESSYFAR